MWLNVGIPALILLGLIVARLVYYVFWRKYWDKRPDRKRPTEPVEVIVVHETQSHLRVNTPPAALGVARASNDDGYDTFPGTDDSH